MEDGIVTGGQAGKADLSQTLGFGFYFKPQADRCQMDTGNKFLV